MNCPTCTASMQNFEHGTISWCLRCGTLAFEGKSEPFCPKLINLCQQFRNEVILNSQAKMWAWRKLGIEKIIFPRSE